MTLGSLPNLGINLLRFFVLWRQRKKIKAIELTYGVENQNFCRERLLEAFRNKFLEFEGKLVIFYPDLPANDKCVQYAYANLEVGHNFFDSNKLNEKIKTAFEKIENKTCTSSTGRCNRTC